MFISGATGDNAAFINGFYEPTQEKGLDGRVLYAKRGDASMCIEHSGGLWHVQPVSSKGKNGCKAYVAGGCALEACTSRAWNVWDGVGFRDAPSVKLMTGAEAERQVRGGCPRARQHAHPPQLQPACPPPPPPLHSSRPPTLPFDLTTCRLQQAGPGLRPRVLQTPPSTLRRCFNRDCFTARTLRAAAVKAIHCKCTHIRAPTIAMFVSARSFFNPRAWSAKHAGTTCAQTAALCAAQAWI